MEATPDGKLIRYLQKSTVISTKEKLLQAIRAFWLPLALADSPDARQVAIEAVYALEQHAERLRWQFNLNPVQIQPVQIQPAHPPVQSTEEEDEGFDEVFG